eukprot:4539433-Amphidinium_carterae.2
MSSKQGTRISGSVSAVSSENEMVADSGSLNAVSADDHSGVIRLAIRMSCSQKLFFVLALVMGFILRRVTGSEVTLLVEETVRIRSVSVVNVIKLILVQRTVVRIKMVSAVNAYKTI